MRELFEFRLFESEARKYFRPDEGRQLSALARAVRTPARGSLFTKVALVESNLRREGRHLVASWSCTRRYTPGEYARALWLLGSVARVFEPAGEECGTVYDSSEACELCGFGARQVSTLRLRTGRIPRGIDIARSIAGEIVVSERFAGWLATEGLTGTDLRPVDAVGKPRSSGSNWYQLVPERAEVEVAAPSAFGVDPFAAPESDASRCPEGHVLGLRRLTELSATESSLSPVDVQATRAAVGHRLGELRPERMLIFSRRFFESFRRSGLKGLAFEVVHVAAGMRGQA